MHFHRSIIGNGVGVPQQFYRKFGWIMTLGLCLLPGLSLSAVWSPAIYPAEVYLHGSYGYMTLFDPGDPDLINPAGCVYGNYYTIPKDTVLAKEMYAMLLAANISGKKVRYYLDGCADGLWPQVHHLRLSPD